MAALIVKLEKDGEEPRYMEWSSISGMPRTYGMTLDEFKTYYRDEYGRWGYEMEFDRRMEQVEKRGCSSMIGDTLDDLLATHRHGEEPLTFDELWQQYVVDRPDGDDEENDSPDEA